MKKNIAKLFKLIPKIAITAVFIVIVVFKIDWTDFVFYIKNMSGWSILWCLVYIVIFFLGLLISAHKWKLLADVKDFSYSTKDFLKYHLIGGFINNSISLFIAGDAYKTYAISGEEKKYSAAASSVMMDRITGITGIMFLAIFFSLINIQTVLENPVLIIINALIIFSLFLDYIIIKLREVDRFKKWVLKIIPEKIILFLRHLYSYNKHVKVVKNATIYGILFSVLDVIILNLILFWILGISSVNLLDFLSVIFIINLISYLPIAISNIGLKEWAYITFLGIFGLSAGAAVAMVVISRLLQILACILIIPFCFERNRKIIEIAK